MLRGALGKRTKGFSSQFEFHATDSFGLNIDRKGATAMALGVTDFVPGFGSASGEITGSAHRSFLRYYFEYGIIPLLLWQEFGFCNFGFVIFLAYGS